MDVTVLYFEGCPGWRTAERRVREALALVGRDEVVVDRRELSTPGGAEAAGFAGSPTVLLDGRDPFAGSAGSPPGVSGLSCRLYPTPGGLAGSPTVDQLVEVLR